MMDWGKGVAQLALNVGDPLSLLEIIPCREHPRSSNVGICAYCLKERLINLICPECGEQRLSSCSCSDDLSSNRNSCTYDVTSMGGISFLLENEKQGNYQGRAEHEPRKSLAADKTKEEAGLSRSSSGCVESRRSGIWKVGKLFQRRKKKESEKNDRGGDQGQRDRTNSELWVFDEVQMSRSRSLRSFRGGDNWNFSGARNGNPGPVDVDSDRKSCFSEAEKRRSGFSDTEMRKSCFSETDARKSVVLEGGLETWNPDIPRLNRRVFSLRDCDYVGGMDERNFIDLRFCPAAESNTEDWPRRGPIGDGAELRSGSCRITSRDKLGMKKSRSFMGWKWGVSGININLKLNSNFNRRC